MGHTHPPDNAISLGIIENGISTHFALKLTSPIIIQNHGKHAGMSIKEIFIHHWIKIGQIWGQPRQTRGRNLFQDLQKISKWAYVMFSLCNWWGDLLHGYMSHAVCPQHSEQFGFLGPWQYL
jgi:hypothetical protein